MPNSMVPEEVSAVASQLAERRPNAPRLGLRALCEVQQGRLRVRRPRRCSSRAVLQHYPRSERPHEVSVAGYRASQAGPRAGFDRPEIPRACRSVLASLRAMGRRPTRRLQGRLARGGQKKGFKAALEVETVTEIEALLGTGVVDWDFEAIEMAARRMAMRVAARVVEQRLNADTSDHAGPMLPCACGQSARYAGRHGKNFESVLGLLRLERAYYHCELCEAGFCPRDRVLGLEGGSLSPGVLRMAGLVGAMVSFEEGHELLHELAGVNVPTKHVERAAEALGREVAADEKLVVEPPGPNEPLAPTLVSGDGWYGCAGAQKGVGRSPRQAARRLVQDARGQARHDLERRGTGQRRHARARRRLNQLLGCGRKRGAQGHGRDAERLRGARRA